MKKMKAFIFTALLVVGFTSVAGAASAAVSNVTPDHQKPVCIGPCYKEM